MLSGVPLLGRIVSASMARAGQYDDCFSMIIEDAAAANMLKFTVNLQEKNE